jgi:two-component system, OmpR family, alkaline phosphatase synthesis response regulator PhoP
MKTILLIEDEDDIREVARASLELTRDWTVHDASTGSTGIEQAIAVQPDAIVLDVMMPDMDGPTTFARLQQDERTHGIPVVLLTAKVQAADRERFERLGVRGVIAKPFDPMALAGQIEALLGWTA